jgi:hypothetical protein
MGTVQGPRGRGTSTTESHYQATTGGAVVAYTEVCVCVIVICEVWSHAVCIEVQRMQLPIQPPSLATNICDYIKI